MILKKLKVRPKKSPPISPCAAELSSMLSCWAASGDLMNTKECKDSATVLYDCMRTTPFGGKAAKPTINYHLARLNKHLK